MTARQAIPPAALGRRLAFVGTTGSGKTYTAKGGVERKLQAKERVVIIDPLDVWWGLRLGADGKQPSPFEVVIFGGKHADMPITENGGKLLGEAVATAKESCIVSLGALRTEAARRRFMVAFLDALYEHTDPEVSEPYTLVIDEADLFAPQKPFGGHAEMLLHLVEEIVRRGRVRGFLPWLISQRPAIVNKNVLSQVDGMVAMQLTGAHDRAAIEGWIEGHGDKRETKELLASLAKMQQGNGLLWVPRDGILKPMHFPENVTFDSSRTPKRGEKKRETKLKPLNLDKLKDRLAAVEAETKANDPAALKKTIADLQTQLRKAKPAGEDAAPSRAQFEVEYRRGVQDGQLQGLRTAYQDAHERVGPLLDILSKNLSTMRVLHQAMDSTVADIVLSIGSIKAVQATYSKSGSPAAPPALTPTRQAEAPFPPARQPSPAAGGDGNLSPAKQRILNAIAWMASLGSPAVAKGTIAFLADTTPNSSAFQNNLGALRSSGLIDYPSGGMVQLTTDGNALAVAPAAAPTHQTIMQKIADKISPAQMRIVSAAANAFPDDWDKDQLAGAIGTTSSSSAFQNNLGRLRSLGFITYPSKGRIRADERLFP